MFSDANQKPSKKEEADANKSNEAGLYGILNELPEPKQIFNQHTTITQQILKTGFGISKSLAPNAINGDRINLTMNYVISHYPSLNLLQSEDRNKAELSVQHADKCYDDHHTLYVFFV